MDFVFMLTWSDQTVADCLDVLDDIHSLGLTHIGFKDVGVSPDVLAELSQRIKAAGATSYMEVVSTSREACLRSARLARDIGVDRLLGGTQVKEVLEILAGSAVRYLPFPGRPFEHPTKLAGSPVEVQDDCRRFEAHGLRWCRSARLPGDRGRSTRTRALGAARQRRHAACRRQRQCTGADPRFRRRWGGCVHHRVRGFRRIVRAAPWIFAVTTESGA